jgi:hypothetical protein
MVGAGVALCGLLPIAANAALGGDVASVERDQRALNASRTVLHGSAYDLHIVRSADGVELHEYVDVTGRVFAVNWSGRRAIDVSTLLGAQKARYVEAARAHRGTHHVLTIHDPDLEVAVMRMPRGWSGHATLTTAVPAGVSPQDLR